MVLNEKGGMLKAVIIAPIAVLVFMIAMVIYQIATPLTFSEISNTEIFPYNAMMRLLILLIPLVLAVALIYGIVSLATRPEPPQYGGGGF